MLANEILAMGGRLDRHISGCEDGQREHTRVINAMSTKLDDVVKTVSGYQRVIAGGWSTIGKFLIGVAIIVGASVVVTMTQNSVLHKDTAQKVEVTATKLANTTASERNETAKAQDDRYDQIIKLLNKHH